MNLFQEIIIIHEWNTLLVIIFVSTEICKSPPGEFLAYLKRCP